MSYHLTLANEALESYIADRMAEAALLWRRAAGSALEVGDRTSWYRYNVWAADATRIHGNLPAALALIISARQDEPEDAPEFEAYFLRVQVFEITLAIRPLLERLTVLVEDLQQFSIVRSVPPGELSWVQGQLDSSRGCWEAALTSYEKAYRDFTGVGVIKCEKAYHAGLCCLRLGRLSACRDWMTSMSGYEPERASNAVWQAELALRLALSAKRPVHEVGKLLRAFVDCSAVVQDQATADEVRDLTVRVHLLDLAGGDPIALPHPSRQELRRRLASKYHTGYRYGARLLLLDYRLACLRFATGVSAVDDLYYRRRQRAPVNVATINEPDSASRLRKARTTAQWTLRYAQKLDTMLNCDWREKEVRTRILRIEQIAKWCAVGSSASHQP